MTSHQGTTYLLHFVQPYQHARHYIGWTAQLDRRLAQHRAGRGSPLIQAAADAGIDFVLVAPGPATRPLSGACTASTTHPPANARSAAA